MERKFSVRWEASDRPSTVPRRIERQGASTLEFWDEDPGNPFHSDRDRDESTDMDAFFTSASHCTGADHYRATPCTKFVVREVRRTGKSVVLVGDGIECHVSGEWCDAEYRVNDRVSIIPCICCKEQSEESDVGCLDEIFESEREGDRENQKESLVHGGVSRRVFVTDTENYLLVEDDPVSITTLSESLACRNRHYINSRVASIRFSHMDIKVLVGIVLHSVMQKALVHKNFGLDFLAAQARRVISENVVLMHRCGADESTVLNETLKLIKGIYMFRNHTFDVFETEKRLMSLVLGIKGNADAIGTDAVLEIKSAKSQRAEHRAQVILYALMLREKTGRPFLPYLYYIPSRELVEVELRHREVVSLVNLRNKLAVSKGLHECACDDRGCAALARIKSLGEAHFLRRQLDAIDDEEAKTVESLVPAVLKYQSSTLVGLAVAPEALPPNTTHISIVSSDFVRISKGIVEEVDKGKVLVRLNEEVVLRGEERLYVSLGSSDIFFKFMRFSLVHVAYPRYLAGGGDGGFALPMERLGLGVACGTEAAETEGCSVLSEELEECFGSDISACGGDNACRTEVPNDDDMCYDSGSSAFFNQTEGMGGSVDPDRIQIPKAYKEEFLRLNDDQRSALFLSLNCRSYRIIHGMPGTGKSTLICLLIKILAHLGKKVLLICYTNLALGNIVRKLKGIKVYRAGKEQLLFKTAAEAKVFFDGIEVVAGTCFSFTDAVYVDRRFDFCVVDEGSQMHLLLTLVPISISSKFVIVGDHLQLKPLSRSSKELSLSLFEYLLGKDHSKLRTQYRMGGEIMRLSNTLFYDNQLCGGEAPSTVRFVDTEAVDFMSLVASFEGCTILCYFNAQVELIRARTACAVETIDRFQGSEDDKVVVVFDPVSKCEVMESSERLNVALTRARKHLVLAGSRSRMMEIGILRRLVEILEPH